jgi:predicted DNA-binding transcriptional regulator YafY
VNRTDRLYALVEELRAAAPRPRSATWLGERFEVSRRTIMRDITTLTLAGVPIWAEEGRRGGYYLDPERTLPPLNITAEEAVAVAVALEHATTTPFRRAARSALEKLLAVMPAASRDSARSLAERIHISHGTAPTEETVPPVLHEALARSEVLHLRYLDREGRATERDVEPLGLLATQHGWYLFAWCRLREAVRAFKLERVEHAQATGERVPQRPLDLTERGLRDLDFSRLDVRVDVLRKR